MMPTLTSEMLDVMAVVGGVAGDGPGQAPDRLGSMATAFTGRTVAHWKTGVTDSRGDEINRLCAAGQHDCINGNTLPAAHRPGG
jgi:hypothetical protein